MLYIFIKITWCHRMKSWYVPFSQRLIGHHRRYFKVILNSFRQYYLCIGIHQWRHFYFREIDRCDKFIIVASPSSSSPTSIKAAGAGHDFLPGDWRRYFAGFIFVFCAAVGPSAQLWNLRIIWIVFAWAYAIPVGLNYWARYSLATTQVKGHFSAQVYIVIFFQCSFRL